MQQNLNIVAFNNLNEPYNSNNIYDTPKLVNTGENVYFSYSSTSSLLLTGNEHWVWDFDYNTPLNLKDNPIQNFIGFTTPFPVSFNRSGDRYVNVNVYERIPKLTIKLQSHKEFTVTNKPFLSIFNPITNNLLVINGSSKKIDIINTNNDTLIKNITATDYPIWLEWCPTHNYIYVGLSNNSIDVINANTETILLNIPTGASGMLSEILYVSDVDKLYVLINDSPSSNIVIINSNNNSIVNTISVSENSYSLNYHNLNVWFVNESNNTISSLNVISDVISTISTDINPQSLTIDTINNFIYIRCLNNVDICNFNVVTKSINTGLSYYSSEIIINNTLQELYIVSGTNSIIQTIDINTFEVTSKTLAITAFTGIFYDNLTNSIIYNYDPLILTNYILTATTIIIDASDFTEQTRFITSSDTNIFYQIPNGKIYGLDNNIDKISSFILFSSNSNQFIDGKLLYHDTIHFNIFKFPTAITGLEYAIEGQNITYTTNSGTNSAQKYEWFINGIKQTSIINTLSFNFVNYIKAIISVNVINGYGSSSLSFTVSLSVGSAVVGDVYEGDVKTKLMFFNKQGDNLNMDLVTDEYGTHWEADLIFDPNSDDTFKSIGLYILESVAPIEFDNSNLITRKLQLFNENGFDIDGGTTNGTNFFITKIENVNNQSGYYTKWLYCNNIEKNIPIGSEIFLTNFYNISINNSIPNNPIITNSTIIQDFNSYSTSGGIDLFTVVGNQKNAIMIISKTANNLFTNSYNYGSFRTKNNNIQIVPQGEVILYNLFKIYDSYKLNIEWNEPFYQSLLFNNKKLSLINSQKNDGVYTVSYINNDLSNSINKKIIKQNIIPTTSLVPKSINSFQVAIDFKTTKVFLGNSSVDFLPASTNLFLNDKSILIWQGSLSKNYTPALLKNGLDFFFEQSNPSINNFNKIYNAIDVDIAINILSPQTSDIQGWVITLNDYNNLSGFKLNFIINNKSTYSATEGINWKRGNSTNDSAKSLATYLDNNSNNVIGLSVIAVNNQVWIWEQTGYSFSSTSGINNNPVQITKGILTMNNPSYGILGDNWVLLNDPTLNGYVHYITSQNNFYILYITGTGSNQITNWYLLPTNKTIVWVQPTDITNPNSPNSSIIDYYLNLNSNGYLEKSIIYFTQNGDNTPNTTPEMIVNRFVNDYQPILSGYGLDTFIYNDNLYISNNYTIKSINPIDDYIDITFQIESGTSGTAGTAQYINSTSSYISSQIVDMVNVLESIKPEKNRLFGDLKLEKSLTQQWNRKILIKDIDNVNGLTITINGINYHTPFNELSVSGLNSSQGQILNVEATLESWGNQKFTLAQEITGVVTDSDVGQPYYNVLELQGILVWLEKSVESSINGVLHFDTLVIESKYPNVNISYSINGTLNQHKVLYNDIEFYDISSQLSLTINGSTYSILNTGGISQTINSWVNLYSNTLFEQNIIVNSLDAIYSTSGKILSYPILRLSTLQESDFFNYTVYIGKSPVLGNPFYNIINYREGNQGIILSGNELRVYNADFEASGFATAMIMSLKNSKFALNNQEYNIIYLNPNVLGLSYQGAFWNNTDTTGYYITRSGGFNWINYEELFLTTNITNGYFSTSGITKIVDINSPIYMEFDAINENLWVSHNNTFSGKITIYNVIDYSTAGEVIVSNNPTFMLWNALNSKMYVSNKGSNRISIIDTSSFIVTNQIPTGISPTKMVIDGYTNYLYVINEDSDDITVINLITEQVISTIAVGFKPVSITIDRNNRLIYISCENSNQVYVIDAIQISLKSFINVGSNPTNIIWFHNTNKVYVSNSSSNNVNVIIYNSINDSFGVKTIITPTNPTSLEFNVDLLTVYVACNNKIQIIDANLDILITTINTANNIGILKYIPFTNSLFYTMPSINYIGLFTINDPFYNITNLPVGEIPNYINWSNNDVVFVSNSGSNFISKLIEVPFINNSSSGTNSILPLSIITRQFLRYPRERFSYTGTPIYFRVSWEYNLIDTTTSSIHDNLDNQESMFFYDFSGNQLYLEIPDSNGNNSLIHDYENLNYKGNIPLLDNNGSGNLINKYNTDISQIYNPKLQQTIFDSLYYQLDYIDSETDIDPRPFPLQIFTGYNTPFEGVNQNTMIIERLENVSLTINTRYNNTSSGYVDIINFDSNLNTITLNNSKLNFIDLGFRSGQIIEFTGYDVSNTSNEITFQNAGLLAKITKVNIKMLTITPLNTDIITETSVKYSYSLFSPFSSIPSTLQVSIIVQPETIAKIRLKGQTEIEDDRFKVLLNNFGYNINFKDVYIFKEYDINEAGVDWIFLNQKRKEMLINYSEIYNYLGSYKALINAVNYFGYNDLLVYEYYLNVNPNSQHYNKLHKIEIPDIFDNSVVGYTPDDFILKSLPNKNYQKTKLFNLTYTMTDINGNYILGYSLDEIITKLLGLKNWLADNIMPVGTRILDITGRGDTPATTTVWHDVKQIIKYNINEKLTPINFNIEAYLQPVINMSKTYNVNLSFFTEGTNFVSDSYTVNIYTFSAIPNYTDPNFKLKCVQKMKYFKTDYLSINFVADINIDPFIMVECTSQSNYGIGYCKKRSYSLQTLAFI